MLGFGKYQDLLPFAIANQAAEHFALGCLIERVDPLADHFRCAVAGCYIHFRRCR
ncbi:hypothetical protein GH984_02405 [Spiribacter sp. C176]|uniref:Uncharacterized protein n=1 Tax=Spiribacter salilacus TaxID=2664894 RepID=A0A6N7QQ92_9GAMM|nr:hypothetical protein [Spiribacter salilacus]